MGELKEELIRYLKKELNTKVKGLIWEEILNINVMRTYEMDSYKVFTVEYLQAVCNEEPPHNVKKLNKLYEDWVYKDKKFINLTTYEYYKKNQFRRKNEKRNS